MRTKPIFLLVLLVELLFVSCHAQETNFKSLHHPKVISSLKELLEPCHLNLISEKTVFLVDIDETLLIAKRNLRRDLDSYHLQEKAYRPVEDDVSYIIHKIHNYHPPSHPNRHPIIIAVTKRSFRLQGEIDTLGHEQLKKMGIKVSRQVLENYNGIYLSHPHEAIGFMDGVLYTNGHSKGYYTMKFLDHINFQPDQIFMIDDLPENLFDVYYHTQARGIPMISFHFTGADKFKRK